MTVSMLAYVLWVNMGFALFNTALLGYQIGRWRRFDKSDGGAK